VVHPRPLDQKTGLTRKGAGGLLYLLDFDDLLEEWHRLIYDTDWYKRTGNHYGSVLVDEAQDCSLVQLSILTGLSIYSEASITVVGDDSQSIYGFRGTQEGVLRKMKETARKMETVDITSNYRSHQGIVNLANAIQEELPAGGAVEMVSGRGLGPMPELVLTPDERVAASMIADQVAGYILRGEDPEEIAVLYSSSVQALPVEKELVRYAIPYSKHGGLPVGAQREVLALSYAIALCKSESTYCRAHLACLFKGVGRAGGKKVLDGEEKLPGAAAHAVSEIDKMVYRMKLVPDARGAVSVFKDWILDVYSDAGVNAKEVDRTLMSLVENAPGGFSKEELLQMLELSNENLYQQGGKNLYLGTIHSAKGLEFKRVYILGLSENLFTRSVHKSSPYREALRLLYVAVTRSKEALTMFAPSSYYCHQRGTCFAEVSTLLSPEARGCCAESVVPCFTPKNLATLKDHYFRETGGSRRKKGRPYRGEDLGPARSMPPAF